MAGGEREQWRPARSLGIEVAAASGERELRRPARSLGVEARRPVGTEGARREQAARPKRRLTGPRACGGSEPRPRAQAQSGRGRDEGHGIQARGINVFSPYPLTAQLVEFNSNGI